MDVATAAAMAQLTQQVESLQGQRECQRPQCKRCRIDVIRGFADLDSTESTNSQCHGLEGLDFEIQNSYVTYRLLATLGLGIGFNRIDIMASNM